MPASVPTMIARKGEGAEGDGPVAVGAEGDGVGLVEEEEDAVEEGLVERVTRARMGWVLISPGKVSICLHSSI